MSATEKNGKTLHLLKSSAKPVPAKRIKRKIPLLGNYEQYKESKKKPQMQGPPAPGQVLPGQPPITSSLLQFMAPQPNSNAEGKGQKDAKMAKK